MNKYYKAFNVKVMINQVVLELKLIVVGILVILELATACSTTSNAEKPAKRKNRINHTQQLPAVINSIPVDVSEIREIRFLEDLKRAPDNLFLTGNLFVKNISNGKVVIKPCRGCLIQLLGRKDTSIVINLTTSRNGSFKFHGQADPYLFMLNEPGLNNITVDTLRLGEGGKIHMTIMGAQGNKLEQFRVSREGETFRWVKVR